jgi:hypothetical protein
MDWSLIFLFAFLGLFMSGSFVALAVMFSADVVASALLIVIAIFTLFAFAIPIYMEITDK